VQNFDANVRSLEKTTYSNRPVDDHLKAKLVENILDVKLEHIFASVRTTDMCTMGAVFK
jgi:hypothetical protein